MPGIISTVISQADKLPIVGGPIGQATAAWLPGYSTGSGGKSFEQGDVVSYRLSTTSSMRVPPPPPYEKVVAVSKNSNSPRLMSKLTNYLWSSNDIHAHQANNGIALVDKQQVEQGVTLLNVATEMDHSGNHQMAMELYMMGLDRVIAALPIDMDASAKRALESKLMEFKESKALELEPTRTSPSLQELSHSEQDDGHERATKHAVSSFTATLSGLLVDSLVYSAVALKRSPVPDVLATAITYAKTGLLMVDDTCHIRQRTWEFASHGLAKAAELDQQYEVQHMMTEALYAACHALVKASMAYAETPGYLESRRHKK